LRKRVITFTKNQISQSILKFEKTDNPVLRSLNLFHSALYKQINESDADIVNLHWINCEMMSIKDIGKITKPVVWTLHDSWAFCGTEHHPNGISDKSFITGYKPQQTKGVNWNRIVFEKKIKHWEKIEDMQIVAPSNWIGNYAKQSTVLKNRKITTIPNPLDLAIFKPYNKFTAREILNLSVGNNIKYILFGTGKGSNLNIKGYDLLLDALKMLNNKTNIQFLICGDQEDSFISGLNIPCSFMGRLNDEYSMSLLYNAADVMVVPSRIDNLPQTATESVSCGVPVVAFNIGGLPDIITHKQTGYLANPFDAKDLKDGICWVLNNDRETFTDRCRQSAILKYSPELGVEQYSNIYKELLNK
jgi:glycosyltransferase involved in cell wall biosynthesis